MTDRLDEAMEARRQPSEEEKEYMRHIVAELIVGTCLRVREQPRELIIYNPHNPAAGQIYVDFEEGHIAWRHVAFEYLGQLIGFAGDECGGRVGREEIVRVLRSGPGWGQCRDASFGQTHTRS